MYFINKQTEVLRKNSFILGIDEPKIELQCHCWGCSYHSFFCVDGMTKVDLHEHLEVMRSDDNKSDRAYEVKLEVLSIQNVQVGKYPYIVLAGNPKLNNESGDFFRCISFV